ncbi:hypothetical protein CsSME_00020581 [Camellia sinensis var. sinensis]
MDGTAELAVGNIVRRVLHIIREEELLLLTKDVGGLKLIVGSDDEDTLPLLLLETLCFDLHCILFWRTFKTQH